MRTRNPLTRLAVSSAVVLSAVVLAAPPSAADEMNVKLHTAAFRGWGQVTDVDGVTPAVEVQASGSECNAVVVSGDTTLVVPCRFKFEAPLDKVSYCTGIAIGPAILTVHLPYPPGFTHEFVYNARAIATEGSIYGFGTADIDVGSLDVRTGWVKFGTPVTECNESGANVGTAMY